MSAKIIIKSDEKIVCPKCSAEFKLDEGIAKYTIEKYEDEYVKESEKLKDKLAVEAAIIAEKKLSKIHQAEIEEFQETLSEKDEKIEKYKLNIQKVKKDARQEAIDEFTNDKKLMEEKLKLKDDALSTSRENELKLLKEKEELEQEKTNIKLEAKRQIDSERDSIRKKAIQEKDEEHKLEKAEYDKKLSDAQKANEDLRKKLESKSQQFTGEVLEVLLEDLLKKSFPQDDIQPIKKGVKGADVLQTIFNNLSQNCGKILWEAKRHENWSDKWIQKLKDDQIEASAEIAVLVTTALPKDCDELFTKIDDLWVISDQLIEPIANTLRFTLLETNKQKQSNVGKSEKMELLYNYLNSPQFVQKIKSVVSTFVGMKSDLDKEKNAMQRLWKKRETQIDRVANNMTSMIGELQGISQDSLTQLNSIEELLLPEADLDDDAN